jgi:hypothetical protein
MPGTPQSQVYSINVREARHRPPRTLLMLPEQQKNEDFRAARTLPLASEAG